MFKWQVTKILHFIRNARYKPAKQRLFKINRNNELCACALGQVALGLNFVSEEEARNYAKQDSSNEAPVYAKLNDFFGGDVTRLVPTANDDLRASVLTAPETFFGAIADSLEKAYGASDRFKEGSVNV